MSMSFHSEKDRGSFISEKRNSVFLNESNASLKQDEIDANNSYMRESETSSPRLS